MKTIAVILTGGQSRRMGRDKSTLPFEGATFLSRLIRRYGACFDGVYVSVDRAGRFDTAGAVEITDLRPGNQGPLAGVEAAFICTDADLIFLTAVDLPFGDPALARRLMELREEAAACYIRHGSGRPEPLFAIYSRACLPAVAACLNEGRRSFHGIFERVQTREVGGAELPEFDLGRILMNVNRPEDFQRALALLEEDSRAREREEPREIF